MPVKIRLQRKGSKKKPFYHIVIADSRAKRDGRSIERLGFYNPMTNPATIELDVNKTVDWFRKGAQPTKTCKAILSYKGVLYKNYLLNGVKKGVVKEEVVDEKFEEWLKIKNEKIRKKREQILSSKKITESKKEEEKPAEIKEEKPAETKEEKPAETKEEKPAETKDEKK